MVAYHPKPKEYDIEKCCSQLFMMYDGKLVTTQLRCDNSMMNAIPVRIFTAEENAGKRQSEGNEKKNRKPQKRLQSSRNELCAVRPVLLQLLFAGLL